MRVRSLARRLALAAGLAGMPLAPLAAQSGAAAPAADARALPADSIIREARRFAEREPWFGLPAPEAAAAGPRTVAAGDTVVGPLAVTGGPLEVHGTVTGDAIVYGGDLVVHPGGSVTGDAIAVLGRVRAAGAVGGEARAVRGSLAVAARAAPSALGTVRGRVGLVSGWFAVVALLGVGVLVFAGGPLEGVVERLERGFGAALLAGIAGQLALLPALLLLVVALAITLIGALLIPFAIVGYVIAAAGLMTLGFLAVARVIGGALAGRAARRLPERGSALRGLVIGILSFALLWLAAALLSGVATVAPAVRGLAVATTWVAVTAGFGAALLSRAGTRRATGPTPLEPEPAEEAISWQTPTPIGGVIAARRPTSASR